MMVRAKIMLRRQDESRSRHTATVILQPQLQSLPFITLRATFFWASESPVQSISLTFDGSVTGACVPAKETDCIRRRATIRVGVAFAVWRRMADCFYAAIKKSQG